MNEFVYIADFTVDDRHELLEYLWSSSREIVEPERIFNIETAKMQINAAGGYAHIICGRKIETYLYNVEAIDPYMYDFHNGAGTVQSIVNEIREIKRFTEKEYLTYMQEDYIDTLLSNISLT